LGSLKDGDVELKQRCNVGGARRSEAMSPITITDRSPATDRAQRERLGIGAENFAARAGISSTELATYEQAKSEADARIATRISAALDVWKQRQNNLWKPDALSSSPNELVSAFRRTG
jgi:hypothetical protein